MRTALGRRAGGIAQGRRHATTSTWLSSVATTTGRRHGAGRPAQGRPRSPRTSGEPGRPRLAGVSSKVSSPTSYRVVRWSLGPLEAGLAASRAPETDGRGLRSATGPRRDHLAGRVDDPGGRERRVDIAARPYRHDYPVAHRDSGVVENTRLRLEVEDPSAGDQEVTPGRRDGCCPAHHRRIQAGASPSASRPTLPRAVWPSAVCSAAAAERFERSMVRSTRPASARSRLVGPSDLST